MVLSLAPLQALFVCRHIESDTGGQLGPLLMTSEYVVTGKAQPAALSTLRLWATLRLWVEPFCTRDFPGVGFKPVLATIIVPTERAAVGLTDHSHRATAALIISALTFF